VSPITQSDGHDTPGLVDEAVPGTAGKFILVNGPFEQWYGFPSAEVIGKTASDLFLNEYAGRYIDHEQEVLATLKSVQREHETRLADGSLRTVLANKFPVFGAENRVLGTATLITDLTDLKTIAEQSRQAAKINAMAQIVGGGGARVQQHAPGHDGEPRSHARHPDQQGSADEKTGNGARCRF